MFVTRQFVYLHQPKTGGTFVATTLAQIHHARGGRVETLWLDTGRPATLPPVADNDALRLMLSARNQHGARRDIPEAYADRPVLATIRSPYDRYVSQFAFGWWRVYPEMFGPVALVRQRYPAYPELTFGEFVQLANAPLSDSPDASHDGERDAPGLHTRQFIDYFFLDPDTARRHLHDVEAWRTVCDAELGRIRFLDQRWLNAELHEALASMDYTPDEIAFVLHASRVRPLQPDGALSPSWSPDYSHGLRLSVQRADPGPAPADDWRRVCDPATRSFIRRKERWLFDRFPRFDI